MKVKTIRKIIKIDEEKCNGCGLCVPSCAEGALKIIDGKAKLVSEKYCDGLGACLGECPQDAITIEERPAEEFDEIEAKQHREHGDEEKLACGCSSSTVQEIDRCECGCGDIGFQPSQLSHWPVQLMLVPARTPFLNGADVLLAADCTAFAYGGFHNDFLKRHALLVACPKLDDFVSHQEKLTQIVAQSGLKSLTVLHMEVPCCSGLVFMARKAIENSGREVPFKDITIGMNGNIKS
ncbi:MAG: 4Fe-4S binding protein [Nitrospira sp.]|nr:4Fe-4S binding protein [Nitrospira sp.]